MRMIKIGKKAIITVTVLCLGMAACSQKEKETDKPQETHITEGVQEIPGKAGNVENVGNVGNSGNSENRDDAVSVIQKKIILAKADLTGDGEEDTVWAEEGDETGLMKGLYLTLGDESGENSLKVPEYIELLCYTKRSTEIRVSCEQYSLGTTTLSEKPDSGTTGAYLEKTFGAKKDGNEYRIKVNADEFSLIDADNHIGSAFWCRGKLCVEEKEIEVTWTVEYSLGELIVTSVELPLWNIGGTDTGWEIVRKEWSERQKMNRYVGYLDESDCFEAVESKQDFDGDGSIDRIWRDITEKGVSYSIRFGNGEELLISDEIIGDRIECFLWKMSEEKSVFWFEDAGSETGGVYTILYLFEQTEAGLKPMELPEGTDLKAEEVSDREICLTWKGENKIVEIIFSLDSVGLFLNFTTEEWLEEYTSEEDGGRVFRINGYDGCYTTEGSAPGRKAIRWEISIGDKWGGIPLFWITEYIDGEWKIMDVGINR